MVFCERGIVINRRQLRENDRIVTVFTEGRGKLEVNFKGVRLARGKLRALSEPVTLGDYRLYLKKGSNFPVCTGGASECVFPGLRGDLGRLYLALHFCELVNRVTPAGQAAPEKFDLLLGALRHLDLRAPAPWLRLAFTLRLLNLAGFGFRETAAGPDSALWDALHDGVWTDVDYLAADAATAAYVDGLCAKVFADHLGIQLRTLPFVAG
jgi:DNA repair protein RecO (recombination protein O)